MSKWTLLLIAALAMPAISVAAPDAPPPLPTLSIELAGLDRATFEALRGAGVYQGLVLRLVDEQVSLVSPHERADFMLRFLPGPRAGELRIDVSSPAASRSRLLSFGPLAHLDDEAVQLDIVHAALELVRQVRDLTPPRSPPPPAVQRLRAEVTAGALWTGRTTGALGGLAGMRRAGPLELGLGLVVHRPLALPGSLRVTEWGALGIAGTGERALGQRLRADARLALGVWQHQWSYASGAGADSGSYLDLAGLLQADAAWRLSRWSRAGVSAGVLWISRSTLHWDVGGTVWRAPSLRPFVGLTLTFGSEEEAR